MPHVEVEDVLSEYTSVQDRRTNHDSRWERAKSLVWPEAGDIINQMVEGQARRTDAFDSTASGAVERFASVMESLIAPRGQRSERSIPTNKELRKIPEVMAYFEKLDELRFRLRLQPRAQFYDQKFLGYMSLGTFGNDCMHIEAVPGFGPLYRYVNIGDVWIAPNQYGLADTVFKKFKLTAAQAFRRWGDDSPESVKSNNTNPKTRNNDMEFLHCVKPRENFDPSDLTTEGMPFASYEISLKDKEFIKFTQPFTRKKLDGAGFRTNPYIYSRLSVVPGEWYGRGIASRVMPEIASLQVQKEQNLIAGQLMITPPIMSMDDTLSGGATLGGFDLRPGANNAGWLDPNGNPKAKTFDYRADMSTSFKLMEEDRNIIRAGFMLDIFEILVDHPQMTATEALIRAQEKGQLISPVSGRQYSEMFGMVQEREISILEAFGWMPEMPQVLVEADGEYEVKYDNAATQLQNEQDVGSIRAWLTDIAPLIEMDPSVIHVSNTHETARILAQKRLVPADVLNSEEETALIIEAIASEQQQREDVETLPALAGAAKDLKTANMLPGEIETAIAQTTA